MNDGDFYLNKSDEELVVLALAEKEAYGYLMQRYEEKLSRYIIRISGLKREDAEDVLQDVFIKVYQKLNDFDATLKFSSWIYRIAHNETISRLRKFKTRPRVIGSESNEIVLELLRADLNIEGDIDRRILTENFVRLMNGLDERYKEVLALKYLEDKDYQEISDVLQKPIGTIATLLSRAKARLKQVIIKESIYLKNYVGNN